MIRRWLDAPVERSKGWVLGMFILALFPPRWVTDLRRGFLFILAMWLIFRKGGR